MKGTFCLRALKDISEGEEITISYRPKADNRHLLQQYGFALPSASSIFPIIDTSMDPTIENSKVEDLAKTQAMGSIMNSFEKLEHNSEDIKMQRKRTIDLLITKLEKYRLNKDGSVSLENAREKEQKEGKRVKGTNHDLTDGNHVEFSVEEVEVIFKKRLLQVRIK